MTRSYLFLLTLTLTACAVGPNYRPPSDPTPTEFKELGAWKPATPRAEMPKGAWWSLLGDPTLDGLEKRVAVTNQNVKQAEAAYRQAAALVRETRAGLFPTLGINSGASRSTFNATTSGAGLSGPVSESALSRYKPAEQCLVGPSMYGDESVAKSRARKRPRRSAPQTLPTACFRHRAQLRLTT